MFVLTICISKRLIKVQVRSSTEIDDFNCFFCSTRWLLANIKSCKSEDENEPAQYASLEEDQIYYGYVRRLEEAQINERKALWEVHQVVPRFHGEREEAVPQEPPQPLQVPADSHEESDEEINGSREEEIQNILDPKPDHIRNTEKKFGAARGAQRFVSGAASKPPETFQEALQGQDPSLQGIRRIVADAL